MSRTHRTDFDVWSRDEFEDVLSRLVGDARSNDVHVEGTYQAWSVDGIDLVIDVTEVFERGRHAGPPPTDGRPDGVATVDVTTRASLAQVLTGLPLEDDEYTSFCRECYDGIQNGAEVTVYCRKPIDDFRWDVCDVYCRDCGVTSVPSPSFGRTDVVVEATVADTVDGSEQTSKQVLNNVRVCDYSPPPDGSI